MLTDAFLKLLQTTAVAAEGQKVFTVPTEPPGTYFTTQADGTLKRYDPTPQIAARANNIGTVVKWAADYKRASQAEIWYSRNQVKAVAFGKPDFTCTFVLASSAPLTTLRDWSMQAKGFEVDQQSLFRLFRTTFADALGEHPDILDIIKRIDIKKAQDVAGEVARKGVSMSRSMLAEATGADKLPPVLTFEVPVYHTPTVPVKARVRVSFDLDAQSEKFRLTVLPGEIEGAEVTGEAALFRDITTAFFDHLDPQAKDKPGDDLLGIPVYYGHGNTK